MRGSRPTAHDSGPTFDNQGWTRVPRAPPPGKEPLATYVLLHGAYQGGWIWQPVATRLRATGHTVYAPTLDRCGERARPWQPGNREL